MKYVRDEESAADVAQEAMLLALRALFSGPHDVLLVSSPCYVGISGAARLLDMLEEEGVIGPGDGAKPREILVSKEEYGEY